MSSFKRLTKHPRTQEWLEAEWLDDYFGPHKYGIRFPDGEIFDPEIVHIEVKHD